MGDNKKLIPVNNEKICPLCGKPNNCGEKPVVGNRELEYCWCAYEIFPRELLELVPEDKKNKVCICPDCVKSFKERNAP